MTKRELAALGVRLMALFALIYGLSSLNEPLSNLISSGRFSAAQGGRFPGAAQPEQLVLWVAAFGPFGALCALSFLLWCFAEALGSLVAGGHTKDDNQVILMLTLSEALVMLLAALGLYFVIVGMSPLLNLMAWWLWRSSVPAAYSNLYEGRSLLLQILGILVYPVFGCLLLFKGRSIARLLPATRSLMTRETTSFDLAVEHAGTENPQ